MQPQKAADRQNNPEQNNNDGGAALPDLTQYYRAIVIKTTWYRHRNRFVGQWTRAWGHIASAIQHLPRQQTHNLEKRKHFQKQALRKLDVHVHNQQ